MNPCICCKSARTNTRTKKLRMTHGPMTRICARLAFEAGVFVVAVRAELVEAADVRTAQEAATVVAPTRSPGLEDGVLVGTCKIV